MGPSQDGYRHPPAASTERAAIRANIVKIAHARRWLGYKRVHYLLRLDYERQRPILYLCLYPRRFGVVIGDA